MKKNGFTLIELLAVIVILAIIALIATPIVLNIIKDSKENSVKLSAEAYVDTVEKTYISKLTSNKKLENKSYSIKELDDLGVRVNGEKPSGENDYVTLQNGKAIEYELTIQGYVITYKDGDLIVDSNQGNSCTNTDILDHTVKFMVDGETYEIVNVKDGNQVNEPTKPKPTTQNSVFSSWQVDGINITFPYTPTADVAMNAVFYDGVYRLYVKAGVSREEYPVLMILGFDSGVCIYFLKSSDYYYMNGYTNMLTVNRSKESHYYWHSLKISNASTIEDIVEYCLNVNTVEIINRTNYNNHSPKYVYTNGTNLENDPKCTAKWYEI